MNFLNKIFWSVCLTISLLLLIYTFYKSEIHWNGAIRDLKKRAKDLADKLGVALNEGILNESSSMALSVYNPTNLADLLTDKVEQTREEKIAIARSIMQQATVN